MLPMLALLLVGLPAASSKGAVAASHPLAAEAGASVMRRGGNAVDAAVAAAFALGVVEPMSSGIGGGGFALLYTAKDRKVRAFDFRERAPGRATPDMFIEDGRPRQDLAKSGALSVAVPSAVRGYTELVKRFGRKPLAEIVGPAEAIAARGFQVGLRYALVAREMEDCLDADPEAARTFLRRDSSGEYAALEPGDRLVQPELARTLHAIGEKGADAFYKGRVAKSIVQTLRERGGVIELDDLSHVDFRERTPMESTYRGHRVATMPLPSSGGFFLLALLNVLEREDARAGGYRPDRFLHVMIEAEKRLFALRRGLGDPAFNQGLEAKLSRMISKDFAGDLHHQIGDHATPVEQLPVPPEHGTTSVSAADGEGNVITITTTVNGAFGSCVVAKGTGVLLNDQMDDFAVSAGVANQYGLTGDKENAPQPGKIPLSSMAPTFLFSPGGELLLTLGAAGGSTIPTTLAQAIIHFVDDGMAVDRAIAMPRIHHNLLPDVVRVEPAGLEAATAAALEARGHKLQFGAEVFHATDRGFFAQPWGKACGVQIDPDTTWRLAACDPRYEGGGATP